MKKHAEAVLKRLRDPSAWPETVSLETFNELQSRAQEFIEKGGLDASLAAILLMHQLAEDLINTLLDDSLFFIQLKLYPLPYNPSRPRRLMFGQVLRELENTVWFQNKRYICERATQLNEIRVPIAHGLTKPGAISEVENNAKKAWGIYTGFAWLAMEAHWVYQTEFADFRESKDWPPADTVFLRDDGSILVDEIEQ